MLDERVVKYSCEVVVSIPGNRGDSVGDARRSFNASFCTLHTSYSSRTDSIRSFASIGIVMPFTVPPPPLAFEPPMNASSMSGSMSRRTWSMSSGMMGIQRLCERRNVECRRPYARRTLYRMSWQCGSVLCVRRVSGAACAER